MIQNFKSSFWKRFRFSVFENLKSGYKSSGTFLRMSSWRNLSEIEYKVGKKLYMHVIKTSPTLEVSNYHHDHISYKKGITCHELKYCTAISTIRDIH